MFKWIKKLLGGNKSGQEVKEEVIPYKRETRLRIAHDAELVAECKNASLVAEISLFPSFSDAYVWEEAEEVRDVKKDYKEWKENNAMVFNYMNRRNNVVQFPQAV